MEKNQARRPNKRKENVLRETEHFLSDIFSSIQDGMSVLDTDLAIIRVNPTMEQWYSHAMPLIGKKCYEAYHGRTERCDTCPTYRTIKTGKAGYEVVAKMGASEEIVGWLDLFSFPIIDTANGKIKGVIEYVRDITERKQAEEALRESLERFRQVAETAGEWIWEVNAKGLYTFSSPIVEKIVGFKVEEIVGKKHFYDLFPPDVREGLKKAAFEIFARKEPFRNFSNTNVAKNGKIVFLETSGTPILDHHGALLGYRGADTDITERKRAEEALRESEERYRTMLDNIEDGYYEVDLPGDLTFFNDSLCRILGYSRDELIGMGNQQYTDPENRKKLFEAFNKAYRTGQPVKEFAWEIIRKDGTRRFGEVSIAPIKNPVGQPIGFRGIARDITERKQAEIEIKKTVSLLNATLESTTDGILVVDREGKIEKFNRKFVRMWHIPESVMASRDDDQALSFVLKQLKDPGNFIAKVRELYSRPEAESFDLIEFQDGRIFERYSQPQWTGEQSVGRVWSFRDVTGRRQAEESLQQSEERYRTLVEESFDGIFFQRGSNIIYANRRLHEMLGYEQGELESRDHWTIYHPDYQALTRERALARLRGESPPHTYEVKFLRKDGSSFWGEINAKVINMAGEPGIQVWARDITERKQAERALIESRETLGMILDGIEADIYIADIETYEILFMNKHMKESFGDDMVGKICWQVFRGDSGPCPHCTNSLLLDSEGNPTHVQVWEGRNPITKQYYLNYDRAIRWIDGRYVRLQVATDITDRKQAEEALKESQGKFRFLAEKMADIIWTVDLDFRTTYVSPSIEKVLGFTPEERKNQSLEQMVTPGSFNRIQSLFLEEFQREKSGDADPDRSMVIEVEYYRKDGSSVWMENTIKSMRDAAGAWVGIYGVSRDISERKRAEVILHAEREKFRSLSEHAPFGMVMVDQDGAFSYINPKFKEIFGYDSSDVPDGRTWFRKAYPDPDYRHQVIAAWLDDLASSEIGEKRSRAFTVRCKDGSEKMITFIPVRLEGGENLMACEDITDLKRAEEALHQTQEQLRQSQKMEAIGGLAGGIAHDFNNLLTVIKGYAELSCLGLDTSDSLRGNIEEILKASERATNLTRQLLAFSRRQILELKVLNLNSLIQDLDKMLRRILGEDIDLLYHLSDNIGKVKTDPGQIEQVILNLAVNARDAMPSGGSLTIETSSVELPGAYARTHIDVSPGHYVMLSVSDNGSGISPEVRERIFEPFFTTKEKGKGTGLGLSTVYGIVRQSGGHIHVYSEPGLGTTFKIYLPRVEEEEDILQTEDDGISLLTGNETILLVEDEPSVRELAARILRDKGYQVYEAPDGREALAIAQRHPERKIHLLLTDVVMPGMSGREVADRLKRSTPDIKVLFISGYTDNAIVHHGVLDKGVNFIQKPFTPEALARKVREALDRS
jgi:PAS domain S-box-containing protein